MALIRPYRIGDAAGVDEVCVLTGAAGGDARGLWSDDGLLPDLYARPYLAIEPETAFVLDEGGRVVGYVMGTADTPRFVDAWRERWLPELAQRWPEPPEPPVTAEQRLLSTAWHPERMLLTQTRAHPAHLHVDLLPDQQGAGHGRALVETFCRAVADAGAEAVHLGVDPANTGALAFYHRLGFTPIETRDGGTYRGRATSTRDT